jgi:hypothetical protein
LREGIVKQWLKEASQRSKEHPEIDLHLFMISTIPNAEEVYANTLGQYSHEDELWIWVSSSQQGLTHLASFLSAFQNASEVIHNHLRLSLIGKNVQELDEVFTHNFLPVERKEDSFTLENEAMAVLYYDAGSINSRKSMISPYLPRLIS